MFAAAIDSHYLAVKARIAAVNSNRQVVGVMSAMDWPPKDVLTEAFYLLVLGAVPLGKQADSATIPVVVHTVQWSWLVVGSDVQKGIQLRSRGDRYRTHFTMKGELLNGTYPRFAQKQVVSLDNSGNLVQTPVSPEEYIIWSPVAFTDRNEKGSGLVYGIGTVRITDMTDAITG
jgi:hypothetical protein